MGFAACARMQAQPLHPYSLPQAIASSSAESLNSLPSQSYPPSSSSLHWEHARHDILELVSKLQSCVFDNSWICS